MEGDLSIPVHIQNVKGLLGFLGLQEMLQVLRQYVRSAKQQSVMQRKEKQEKFTLFSNRKGSLLRRQPGAVCCAKRSVNSCAGWRSETLLAVRIALWLAVCLFQSNLHYKLHQPGAADMFRCHSTEQENLSDMGVSQCNSELES